jgi:hypothetical protein
VLVLVVERVRSGDLLVAVPANQIAQAEAASFRPQTSLLNFFLQAPTTTILFSPSPISSPSRSLNHVSKVIETSSLLHCSSTGFLAHPLTALPSPQRPCSGPGQVCSCSPCHQLSTRLRAPQDTGSSSIGCKVRHYRCREEWKDSSGYRSCCGRYENP